MEGSEGEMIDEAQKLQIALRCAKSALLLYSLRLSVNGLLEASYYDEDEREEKMRSEIENLKVELGKERLKMKKIKLRGNVELILLVISVMLISFFVMKPALDSLFFDDEFLISPS